MKKFLLTLVILPISFVTIHAQVYLPIEASNGFQGLNTPPVDFAADTVNNILYFLTQDNGTTQAYGTANIDYLAKYENDTMVSYGGPFTTNQTIADICLVNGDLWMSGPFNELNMDFSLSNLCIWDGSVWSDASTPAEYSREIFDFGTNAYVARGSGSGLQPIACVDYSLANCPNGFTGTNLGGAWFFEKYNGDLIAGGFMTTWNAITVNNIARYDGSNWHALGLGMDGAVQCLTVFQGDLYAGGQFLTVDGDTVNHIARWDGNNWWPLGNGVNDDVNTLTVWQGALYVGGAFNMVDGYPMNGLAKWDGQFWSPASSLDLVGGAAEVYTTAVLQDTLFLGGDFATINQNGSILFGASRIAKLAPAAPEAIIVADNTVCMGDTVQLVNWSTGPIASSNWTFTGATTSSSTDTHPQIVFNTAGAQTITLTVNNGLGTDVTTHQVSVVNFQADAGNDVDICTGAQAQLQAGAAASYAWENSPFLSDTTIGNPTANVSSNTTFYLHAIDANGCASTDSVTVFVHPYPTAIASSDTAICPNTNIVLNASGGTSYAWQPDSLTSAPNDSSTSISISGTTTFEVIVSNVAGCSDTANVIVSALPLPTASFVGDNLVVPLSSGVVNFTDQSTGATSWEWFFGDGNSAAAASPSHMYLTADTFDVMLVITNASGCTDTAFFADYIIVYDDVAVGEISDEIEFSIAPNPTDGQITISFAEVVDEALEIEVYSSLGQLVYSSNLKLDSSDASISLDDLPDGNYWIRLSNGGNRATAAIVLQR